MDRNQIDIQAAAMHGKTLLDLQDKKTQNPAFQPPSTPIVNRYDQKQDQTERFLRRLPKGIDIVQEFELIQQKKSKLSRWQRDMIERIFNSIYKKADQ
jgi:hypothetical protein